MVITSEIIEEFNEKMKSAGSIIRLKERYSNTISSLIDIELVDDKYLAPTDDFYNELELFFKNNGAAITYDYDKLYFWTK